MYSPIYSQNNVFYTLGTQQEEFYELDLVVVTFKQQKDQKSSPDLLNETSTGQIASQARSSLRFHAPPSIHL